MGLAGRKQKQRIPADPRNLSWADDASRFGHSYLAKFGWDASQGLGPSGDGMKTHLKVEQKLDVMGIGAQHQRDPNGIAWKQNKEFEALLKKLNESVEQKKGAGGEDAEEKGGRERETTMVDKAFVRAQEEHENVEGETGPGSSVTIKKRKHQERDDPDTSAHTRKKQKKEKRQQSSSHESTASAIDSTSEPPSAPHPEAIPKPRPMAHRARVRAAKRIAGKPASAISEILGIAPSSSVSTSTSTPALTLPSTSTPASPPSLSLDNLTTSTKSVADYFKEKLLARSSSSFPASSSSSAPSGSSTPGLGATRLGPGLSDVPAPDDGEPPRRGIGSQAPVVNADGQYVLTEKQRRKAERKAEKRKRREAETIQAAPESASTDVKGKMEEDDVEKSQRTSDKHKKQKKCREQEQQAPTDQPNDNSDDIIKKPGHEHDVASGSLPEPIKKSTKDRKKKRS